LREGRSRTLADFSVDVDSEFFDQTFTLGTVNTRTFILLLAQALPLSFVSGTPVTLSKVLQAYNRNEFHHLMPQAFLKDLGASTRQINPLANFAIISASDNKILGGVAPSLYRAKMPAARLSLILGRALCPDVLFADHYEDFIEARSARLVQEARTVMGIVETDSSGPISLQPHLEN
jgi:hypothetical protein